MFTPYQHINTVKIFVAFIDYQLSIAYTSVILAIFGVSSGFCLFYNICVFVLYSDYKWVISFIFENMEQTERHDNCRFKKKNQSPVTANNITLLTCVHTNFTVLLRQEFFEFFGF